MRGGGFCFRDGTIGGGPPSPTRMSQDTVDKVVRLWPWAVGGLVLVALCFAWTMLPVTEWLKQFSDWVKSLGLLGVVAFGLAYVIGTLLLVPASPLTFAAGVAWGFWALPLVVVVASLGATGAFLVSRYFVRHRVREAIDSRPAFRAAAEAVDEEGWKVLLLLRLSPAVPFNAQNYLYGVTSLPLLTYVWATIVGIIPGVTLNVYLASLGAKTGEGGMVNWMLLAIGLVATAVVVVLVGRKARAKLREHGIGG
jgi:uncharacterized membrane protein YdjX (TVP38/TMEM64 family)